MQFFHGGQGKIWAVGCLSLFLGAVSPTLASAASAYLTTDYATVAVGDTLLVSVAFDSGGKTPNTIEGTVLLKNSSTIEIKDFRLADSVLTNWLKTPSFEEGSKISFAGGVPGGFDKKDALLFQIAFTAKTEGQIVFTPADMKAYDNDGKATVLEVATTPLTITIGPKGTAPQKNQWQDILSQDNESPQNLTVDIGRDDSVFEGRKFMTIAAVDTQSGIDHFEVAEGDRPAVRTGSPYVLQDQSESSPLLVTAYDKAGNKSSILLHPEKWWQSRVVWLGIFLFLGIGGAVVWKRSKWLKKKNVSSPQ